MILNPKAHAFLAIFLTLIAVRTGIAGGVGSSDLSKLDFDSILTLYHSAAAAQPSNADFFVSPSGVTSNGSLISGRVFHPAGQGSHDPVGALLVAGNDAGVFKLFFFSHTAHGTNEPAPGDYFDLFPANVEGILQTVPFRSAISSAAVQSDASLGSNLAPNNLGYRIKRVKNFYVGVILSLNGKGGFGPEHILSAGVFAVRLLKPLEQMSNWEVARWNFAQIYELGRKFDQKKVFGSYIKHLWTGRCYRPNAPDQEFNAALVSMTATDGKNYLVQFANPEAGAAYFDNLQWADLDRKQLDSLVSQSSVPIAGKHDLEWKVSTGSGQITYKLVNLFYEPEDIYQDYFMMEVRFHARGGDPSEETVSLCSFPRELPPSGEWEFQYRHFLPTP